MKLKTTTFLLLCIFLFDSCFTRKQETSAKNFDVVETNIDAIHQAFKKGPTIAKFWFLLICNELQLMINPRISTRSLSPILMR